MGQNLKTNENIVYKTTVNSLLLADKLKLKSIAFPAIGTGVGGLALDKCAKVMLQAVVDVKNNVASLETVQFVLFDYYSTSQGMMHLRMRINRKCKGGSGHDLPGYGHHNIQSVVMEQ